MPTSSARSQASLKDELHELKATHILREAGKLFVECGFVGTTMDAIAARLDMSKPFIYQFFKSKHAILVALYDRELRDSLAVLTDVSARTGPVHEQLLQFVRVAVRKNVTNQGLTNMLALEEKHLPAEKMAEIRALEARFNRNLKDIVTAGVQAGVFHVDNPGMASRAIMGMLLSVKRWYRPSGSLGVDAIAEQFCDFALRIVGYGGLHPDTPAT
ncbi:TetR/AcrR family transcriptional regulator [Bordetella sp. BOR01]|uniref:TetR/AcrR family transcriptional regulator n=1 Tax=Bordetella sp. BOR01 TaxID=2854779 RepID=UPI001C47853D|nr:TetR/AcrR family transcriptional regulator [Bordetella sp. BOR01]MBV7484564.1 TetR/AcrR family transcriptional regulator [Bordetella sp. BOR01]